MKLNCDLGESFGAWNMGQDEAVMPYIDMANIACGFHASDPVTIEKTIALANEHHVLIGAHPGYPDLVGFGRRSMKCSADEVRAMLLYQVSALSGMAQVAQTQICFVKPHGALYNDMMRDDDLMQTILKTIALLQKTQLSVKIPLVIQATAKNDRYRESAAKLGVELLFEAFADRGYDDEGLLLPRSVEGAVFHQTQEIIERVELLSNEGILRSASGKLLKLSPDTLCVHGDNAESIKLVAKIRGVLDAA